MMELIGMAIVVTGIIGYVAIAKWNLSMDSNEENL